MSHLDGMLGDLPPMLRVSQVAKVLGKSNQGVLRWINTGVLPAYKLGDTWFILRDDLRDAMSAGGNLHAHQDSPRDC
ncbi:MAG: helix-turn-helix domain-containing protein [Candidatus Nanopelagicales bacterium]